MVSECCANELVQEQTATMSKRRNDFITVFFIESIRNAIYLPDLNSIEN